MIIRMPMSDDQKLLALCGQTDNQLAARFRKESHQEVRNRRIRAVIWGRYGK